MTHQSGQGSHEMRETRGRRWKDTRIEICPSRETHNNQNSLDSTDLLALERHREMGRLGSPASGRPDQTK
eukprot:11187750-Lingulodinium_polyedra.AAC.1